MIKGKKTFAVLAELRCYQCLWHRRLQCPVWVPDPAAVWGCIDLDVILDCIQNIFAEQFFAVGCVLQEDSCLSRTEMFTLVTD